jgi:hypothetical protein
MSATLEQSKVKVGRREFNHNDFTNAVHKAKTYSELCELLGMNKTVQTTINALKEKVVELNLNTDHFTYKFNISDKMLQAAQHNTKQFNIMGVNKTYYNLFEKSFAGKPASWAQYKVHSGDFLEKLGDKDFATITIKEIEDYVSAWGSGEKTKANCKAHIRSMLIFVVKENIENAIDIVSKEMLIWLI